jgi:hypothetical protein
MSDLFYTLEIKISKRFCMYKLLKTKIDDLKFVK